MLRFDWKTPLSRLAKIVYYKKKKKRKKIKEKNVERVVLEFQSHGKAFGLDLTVVLYSQIMFPFIPYDLLAPQPKYKSLSKATII